MEGKRAGAQARDRPCASIVADQHCRQYARLRNGLAVLGGHERERHRSVDTPRPGQSMVARCTALDR